MNGDNYLNKKESSRAHYDRWWWLYFLGMHETICISIGVAKFDL